MDWFEKRMKKAALILCMLLVGIIVFFPLVWVLLLTFQPSEHGVSFVMKDIFAKGFTWNNFKQVSQLIPMARNFWNSTVVAVVGTLLTLFFCALGGYGFAKFRFPGKDLLFLILLLTMVIPPEVTIVPMFVIMKKLKLINSLWSLIIPRAATAVGIFYMRQYISSYPTEIIEQARIDGCAEFSIFTRIIIPGITPALASWGAISLVARWNDFMMPMIFLRSSAKQTLMVAISQLPVSEGLSTPWTVIMAGVAIATLPLIVAFVILQKYDIADKMAGASKG